MVVSLKIFIRESLFYLRKLGIKSHRQNSSKDTWPHTRNRETKKIHRKELCKKCEPQERNPCAPRFEERTQCEILHRERWDLARSVHRLENTDKAALMGNASTLFEKARGVRIRGRFRQDPTMVVTANGEVQTNEEAQVYVHDLDLFVTVQILDDTLAFRSLGKLCEEHGCSHEWATGQQPHLAPVRLLHRYGRTHQEHLQVQQKCGVTIWHQETGAIAQKVKAK